MVYVYNFSSKYVQSIENIDPLVRQYYHQISNIANNLLKIKIYEGVSEISHNFDKNYNELIEIIIKQGNYKYFIDIKKIDPLVLVCKDINNIILPDNCFNLIDEYIDKKIPFYVVNDIINFWFKSFETQIYKIQSENRFDLNWYDYDSLDYIWASKTITNCNEILFKVGRSLKNYVSYTSKNKFYLKY